MIMSFLFIFRQPWPTPTPRSATREPAPIPGEKGSGGEAPCDNDDEDCGGSGSGTIVDAVTPSKAVTDDIYLHPSPEPSQKVEPEKPWEGATDNNDNIDEIKIPNNEKIHSQRSTTDNMVITVNMTETPPKKSTHNVIATKRPYVETDSPNGQSIYNAGPVTGPTPKEDPVNQGPNRGPLELNIALIIGIAAGILLLLLILAYALYKYKSRDEGSYKIDESKNYQYPDTASKPSSQVNGGVSKSGMQASKPKSKKDVKEWYVWFYDGDLCAKRN